MRLRKFIAALVCLVLPLQAVAVTGLAPRIAAVVAAAHEQAGHADHAAHHQDAEDASGETPRDCDVCGECTPCLSTGGLAAPTGVERPLSLDGAARSHGAHADVRSFTPEVPKRPPLSRSL